MILFAEISARPLRIGELLSLAWSITRQHFKPIFLIVLAVYLPINLFLVQFPEFFSSQDRWQVVKMYFNLVQWLETLIGVLALAALAIFVESVLKGQPMRAGLALSMSLRKWLSLVSVQILAYLVFVGGLICLIVPGIIFLVQLFAVVFVAAAREKRGLDALHYSRNLVQGRWWSVFGRLTGIYIVGLTVSTLATLPTLFFPPHWVFDLTADLIFDGVFAIFQMATILLFFNLDYVPHLATPNPGTQEASQEISGDPA